MIKSSRARSLLISKSQEEKKDEEDGGDASTLQDLLSVLGSNKLASVFKEELE